VAAYCRVSTKQDEQLNSYEVQKQYYTEKINSEPKWCLAGIYADKGITGTSTKNRDEFNKMIRDCKKGKIDRIITKSISRFARNTLDCLKYVRMLKELNVDIYFEEQGIHSIEPGAEFYITIYGSIAQSESENTSANVRWGKEQAAKEGKVSFVYSNFLGYKKGDDGQPEIVQEEAEIVRIIYDKFLKGESLKVIADSLTSQNIPTPRKKVVWTSSTVRSILSNEKYMGDALINKTYTVDFLSKKVKANNGERPKYYVENNHPAIIDRNTFNISTQDLENKIQIVLEEGKLTPKVIVPVDLFGLPADYQKINKIGDKYGLKILEDGAQGFGGTINGQKVCSFGHISTTSFFPAKPLGCYGDGGAIFTDDNNIAALLRSLCVHGKGANKYDNIRIGVNSRLDTLQAAILSIKLKAFKQYELRDIQRAAEFYSHELQDIVDTPFIPVSYTSSYAQYTIKVKNNCVRDDLQSYLSKNGIPSMVYYYKPMHLQKAFNSISYKSFHYPVSEELCNKVLSLPIHPYITQEEQQFVCNKIREFIGD